MGCSSGATLEARLCATLRRVLEAVLSLLVQTQGLVSVMPAYVRRGFIRKVYSILCVQLALTVAIGAAFVRYTTPAWVAKNIALFYVASFGSLLGL